MAKGLTNFFFPVLLHQGLLSGSVLRLIAKLKGKKKFLHLNRKIELLTI